MTTMEKLKQKMYVELDDLVTKEYMTVQDLDLVYKIVDVIKDVCEIEKHQTNNY